jgi:D-arabinose 1-dehydrogenase-like Zn-dependent alcohol dehydrogenase
MAASMRSARLHEAGQPLRIDRVEIPEPRPRDVLVRVKACGIIPNMNAIFSGRLWNHLPPLPASVGLDAAGVIAEVGSEVTDATVGDRVYVNPWLSCGMCSYCRTGEPMLCSAAAFQGYFGFFPHSTRQLLDYPFGGFSEYTTASPQRLVHFAAASDIRPGGALRLPRHVVRRAASWPGARRQLGRDQRNYRHAGSRRDTTRPCHGSDAHSRPWPQS